MNPKEALASIQSQAVKDAAFRAELKKDPKAAVEKLLGVKLPQGLSLKVVEDSATAVHLVLPPAADGPLAEGDLGKVSGGAAQASRSPQCGNSSYIGIGC